MIYEEGTIIKKRNIRFKETNMLDSRLTGHPVVIPLKFDFYDEDIYFLTMSSQDYYYLKEPSRFYVVKPDSINRLKKPSYIDLKFVYKDTKTNIPEMGFLHSDCYKKLIKRLIDYQNNRTDPDFINIKGKIQDVLTNA